MCVSYNCYEPKIGRSLKSLSGKKIHWYESSHIVFFLLNLRFPDIDHLSQAKNQEIKISFTLKAVIEIKKKDYKELKT